MNILRKYFPLSFRKLYNVADLVVCVIIYVVAALVSTAILGVTAYFLTFLPVIGPVAAWTVGILGTSANLYCVGGAVIAILYYNNVLKD